MSTKYLAIEDLAPLTHYERPDPLYIFFAVMLCYFLGSFIEFAVAKLFRLLRSPADATTQTLINALTNKKHPIHDYLQAYVQRSGDTAVKAAIKAMEDKIVKTAAQAVEDKLGDVIETQFMNEVVIQAVEKELRELRDKLPGGQQCKIGPRNKLRRAISNLQAPLSEGVTYPTISDDLLDPPKTPPMLSPFSSSTSTPTHDMSDHDASDSDSLYGSDSKSKEFDDELAALAGYESDGAGSASEQDSDVDAEGETDDENIVPPVKPAPTIHLPSLGNSAKRQIKPLSSMKTKGTRR